MLSSQMVPGASLMLLVLIVSLSCSSSHRGRGPTGLQGAFDACQSNVDVRISVAAYPIVTIQVVNRQEDPVSIFLGNGNSGGDQQFCFFVGERGKFIELALLTAYTRNVIRKGVLAHGEYASFEFDLRQFEYPHPSSTSAAFDPSVADSLFVKIDSTTEARIGKSDDSFGIGALGLSEISMLR